MTLEDFMRCNAIGNFSLLVYGVAPGYLKIKVCPGGELSEAIEYWVVGNVLLTEQPDEDDDHGALALTK